MTAAAGMTVNGKTDDRLSLDQSIEVVAPDLLPSLVAPDQLRRIRALAAVLPPVAVAGFECRLAGGDQVDLAVHLPSLDNSRVDRT